jgi:uncharacterized protein (TIGR02145 family)
MKKCLLVMMVILVAFVACQKKDGIPTDSMVDYVDEYGINQGPGIELEGVVWAPVNCGYHKDDYKYGKLYQWGRKYGQGYSKSFGDASGAECEKGPISVDDGQKEAHSNIFFKVTEYPGDWAYPQDGKLWNSGTEVYPRKTEYDPCPEGWRVPVSSELDKLKNLYLSKTTVDGKTGYCLNVPDGSSSIFFPAAGSIFSERGKVERDESGYYWSSTQFNDDRACLLWFENDEVSSACSDRSSGHSVRCVQE